MQVKRFIAADMTRALKLVREDLGEDAMILSTQRTAKGVELMASLEMPDKPFPEASGKAAQFDRNNPKVTDVHESNPSLSLELKQSSVGPASGKTREQLADEMQRAREKMLAIQEANNDLNLEDWAEQQSKTKRREPDIGLPERSKLTSAKSDLSQQAIQQLKQTDQDIKRLQDEIFSMRDAFSSQLEQMASQQNQQWEHRQAINEVIPLMSSVKQKLRQLGITQACNDDVIVSLKSFDAASMTEQQLWHEALARLAKKIPSLSDDPVSKGGRYALLGPTGVGKTTTIAKLAARYVIAHGPEKVSIITTDKFRLAAQDQLQALGKILNVKVSVVDDLMQLPDMLQTVSNDELVLIDTPGMRYGDENFKSHLTALRRCQGVNNILTISANSQYQMMQSSIHRYRLANLHSCILTKLDECASLGDAISLLTANDLPLSYITNGQAVPDDLDIIKPHQLLAKAVSLSKNIHKQTQSALGTEF